MTTHREGLFERGLCRSCELPLLDSEVVAGARNCGVCRTVRAIRTAKKRDPDRPVQEIEDYYRPRLEAEQAKRRAAGLPSGGRTSRDRVHSRRRRGAASGGARNGNRFR